MRSAKAGRALFFSPKKRGRTEYRGGWRENHRCLLKAAGNCVGGREEARRLQTGTGSLQVCFSRAGFWGAAGGRLAAAAAVTGGRGGGGLSGTSAALGIPRWHTAARSLPPGVPERVPHAAAILQLLLLFVEDGPQRSKRSKSAAKAQHGGIPFSWAPGSRLCCFFSASSGPQT